MKIGVCDRATSGWTSGSEYTRAQVAALLAVQEQFGFELHVVADTTAREVTIAGTKVPISAPPTIAWGSRATRVIDRVRRKAGVGDVSQLRQWREWVEREGFDVLLSFIPLDWWQPSDVAVCAWLWDFQHAVLPEMFPREQRERLDVVFRGEAERADLVIVSSEASQQDYLDFVPELADKVRVYRFPSRFAFDPSLTQATSLDSVREKFHIDRDFFLVVNQFWQHKNHPKVIEAAAILKQQTGDCPQIVMIGNPYDDRDPSGQYISTLMSGVAEHGLEGRVKILGFVSGAERDALFRSCQALIQPSSFEGWNTSIEDAKAIGRPVIASGLDVHREQLPDSDRFFDTDDAGALAQLLADAAGLPAGPDLAAERAALELARASLTEIGQGLYAICQESIDVAARRRAASDR